jgi:negative regulator of flagellin synthesis FlgM
MSNRIVPVDPGATGRINKSAGKSATTEATGAGSRPGGTAGAAAPAGDRVELTGRGRIVAQAGELLASIPPVDDVRVAEVRLAIENGEYVIDAQKIADALLRSDLEIAT